MNAAEVDPKRDDHDVQIRRDSFPPNTPPLRRTSMAPSSTLSSGCVGREPELARLREHLAQASDGAVLGVFLDGQTGVGKSRIVAEFKTRVRLEGGVVLDGTSGQGGPYGSFAGIVADGLRFLRDLGREPSFDLADLGCVGGCHPLWHQHQGAACEGRSPGESRARFFEAIGALLREVAVVRAPVILLRDLDRADSGTLDLLEHLLATLSLADLEGEAHTGALFLATADGDLSGKIADLACRPEVRRMPVGNLDVEGVRAMLASAAIVERVLAATGGAPEAIERLLQTAPVTRDTWLTHRIAAASSHAQALIEALAVFGAPADLDTLARIAEVDPDAETNREFASLEFLAQTSAEGLLQFRFAHEIARDKAYLGTDSNKRVMLHDRAIAECAGDPVQATRHAIRAANAGLAAAFGLQAAQNLSAQHAQADAAALLEDVLALGPAASRELRDFLIDLYRAIGSYKPALAHLDALRAQDPTDPTLAKRTGEILTLAGDLEKATRVLEEARTLSMSSSRVSLPDIDAMVAELLYQRGLYEDAAIWAERAQASAQDTSVGIRARNVLGKIAFGRDIAAAETIFRENAAAAAGARLGHEEAAAWVNIGIARLRSHDLAGAEDAYARAFELAHSHSDTHRMALATENLAVLQHVRRNYAGAQTLYQEALALWRKVGNKTYIARLAINLGELYESLGDLPRARSLLHLALQTGISRLTRHHPAEAFGLQGRIELSAGQTALARAAFQGALEIWQTQDPVCADDTLFGLTRVELADGDLDAARRWLDLARGSDSPKKRAIAAVLRAEIARSSGEPTSEIARQARAAAEETADDELRFWSEIALIQAFVDEEQIDAALARLQTASAIEERLRTHVPHECIAAFDVRPLRLRFDSLRAELTERSRDRLRISTSSARGSVPPMAPRARSQYPEILGDSQAIRRVLTMLDKVGPSDCLVLVRGESGTGKELVADALHRNSRRRDKPIVKVNCAALVETLLLSELFGHERGAFTGANARRRGRFELADGGTLFLDEIGDISPKTQVALLRVLQEREFERVGGTQPVRVDVRIVAATHRDLEQMVREGTFREDLYYRLRGVSIDMPALRNRLEDLPALVEGLLGRIAEERTEAPKRISPDALKVLAAHRWPGNIRELENVLRSASLFAEDAVLEVSDFQELAHLEPVDLPSASGPSREEEVVDKAFARIRGGAVSLFDMKKEIERECIVRALQETQGNITHAATLLGMKRPRLSQLVKEYGLQTNGALS